MPLGKGKLKTVSVIENGSGRTAFIFMTSIAFAISGVLEKLPEPDRSNATLDRNRSDVSIDQPGHGRRYCDPPNITAFAIYYESTDEANVEDYDFFQSQMAAIQNNVSELDRAKQIADVYFNLGFVVSFVPACFFISENRPDKLFLYGISSGVLLKLVFIEAKVPLQISAVTSGFILGIAMFSFYNMAFRFITSGRNSIISFASVRHVGLAIGELLVAFPGNRKYVLYATVIISVFWLIVWSRLEFTFSNNDCENRENRTKCSRPPTPWKKVLGSRPVWMTVAAIFGASCGSSSIFVAMRLNLKYVYYSPVEVLSAVSGLLHAGFAVSCGFFIDYLTEAQIVSVTTSRRMIVYVSHFIPSGFLFVLGFLGCAMTTPMIFYCLAIMTTGANYTGALSSPMDLAPKYLGPILAFSFTFGSFGSLFMSHLILYILTNQVFVSWRFIFSLNSLILLLTAIFFMLRGSGSVQQWNNPRHKLTKRKKNNNVEQGRTSVAAPVTKQRTKSIYVVEKKILKVLHVQEPDKFTRVRAYSTSFPTERSAANTHIYRPSNKKRASIS